MGLLPIAMWSDPAGSSSLIGKIVFGLLLGVAILFALTKIPTQMRRSVVFGGTFLAGLFYVLFYLWPQPITRGPNDIPRDAVEGVGFWLKDSFSVVVNFTQIISGFMLGLGVYSLLRIHLTRITKGHKDAFFSVVLLASMVAMAFFAYADYNLRLDPAMAQKLENPDNWGFVTKGRDLLFDGMLQQMDAAMFSVIAFFILSAAYRAFRVRSVEATILLATALLVILSLMGLVAERWDAFFAGLGGGPNDFFENFKLTTMRNFIRDTFQTPSINGITLGTGIGALAMGLRIWLGLEKGSGN